MSAPSISKLELSAAVATHEDADAYADREAVKRPGGSPRGETSGTTVPVPVQRRSAKTPRAPASKPMFERRKSNRGALAVGASAGSPILKSPRRLDPQETFTAPEKKILELFAQLDEESQLKMLDAMEDHMDEEFERAQMALADAEERRIKEAKVALLQEEEAKRRKHDDEARQRLAAINAETDRRQELEMKRKEAELKARELEEAQQQAHMAAARDGREPAPMAPELLKQKSDLSAEVERLRALEAEELRRIHELEVRLREQAQFGYAIGAHGAQEREAANSDVVTESLPGPGHPPSDKQAHPALEQLERVSGAPVPAPRKATFGSLPRPTAQTKAVMAAAVAAVTAGEHVEKSRNPRLANLAAMMMEQGGGGSAKGYFADTPDVQRKPIADDAAAKPVVAAPVAAPKAAPMPHAEEPHELDAKRNPALARLASVGGVTAAPKGTDHPAPAPVAPSVSVDPATEDDVAALMRSVNRPSKK